VILVVLVPAPSAPRPSWLTTTRATTWAQAPGEHRAAPPRGRSCSPPWPSRSGRWCV